MNFYCVGITMFELLFAMGFWKAVSASRCQNQTKLVRGQHELICVREVSLSGKIHNALCTCSVVGCTLYKYPGVGSDSGLWGSLLPAQGSKAVRAKPGQQPE